MAFGHKKRPGSENRKNSTTVGWGLIIDPLIIIEVPRCSTPIFPPTIINLTGRL
jgi:hypothetical protein